MTRILVLPKLRIQNCNALSSPITVGVPAMTAWLGAVHALQRKLNHSDIQSFNSIKFNKVGLILHEFDLQTKKPSRNGYSFLSVSRNPIGHDGKPAIFVDEARCHQLVSMVISTEGISQFVDPKMLSSSIFHILQSLKIASGDVISCEEPFLRSVGDNDSHRKLLRQLMPGYALIERRDLVCQYMEEGKDALDAILECVCVNSQSESNNQDHIQWTDTRNHPGWIIPISVGYHGLTALKNPGETQNQRDPKISHIFAESIVTIGEFVMTYRFKRIDEIFWSYEYFSEKNLYVCRNQHVHSSN